MAISLKARAIDGDVQAQKIYLQALGGNFGRTQKVEVSAVPGITINLSPPQPENIQPK